MRRVVFFVLVFAAAAWVSDAVFADALILKDGRIFDGRKMERVGKGVKVHFANGEVLVPNELIQDAVIQGDTSWVPKTPEEKEKAEKGLVPFEGRWLKPQRRDAEIKKRLDAKRAEVEALKDLRHWRNRKTDKTKHFEFQYTVAPHIFEYYRDMMEAYYTAFAKSWKIGQPKGYGRLLVCFYTNLEDFHQVGGAGGGVRGYFRFVPPLELNFYYDRSDPRYTEEVMFHEANHYLQKLIDPDFKMPHFPGESIAEYYGASEYDGKKLRVGLIQEGRLTEIQTDIAGGEWMDLEKLIKTDGMYQHYTWGWSLTHYLLSSKRYKKKFEKFVLTLAKGKNVKRQKVSIGSAYLRAVTGEEILRVFMLTMGIKNKQALKDLEKEWHEYIKEKLVLVTARGKEKAAFGAMNTGRVIRAKRLFKEAIDAGSTNPLTYHRYAELLERDNKRSDAIPLWRKAIEFDPLNARFYASVGKAMHREGQEEEGAKLMKLALEIAPEDIWLEYEVNEYLDD